MENINNETARKIKQKLMTSYNFIRPDDIRVTNDIDSYHPGTNRQASRGKVSCFVLVEAPEIPEIKSDSFYQRNPHRSKPTEVSVKNAEEQVEMIRSACKTVADMFDEAEFIDVSENVGFDSSHGGTQYMNIRIRSE